MGMSDQFDRLGTGDGKIKLRSEDGETHWLNVSADQIARVKAVLSENDSSYTLTTDDVGKTVLHAFGSAWKVEDFMGRILAGDVGKRVFRRPVDGAPGAVLQVENDQQRDRRLAP
jgi:hypothetical protein